ncbi:Hypothetical protein, putative [Bodo saltans]|uniref:AAA+ ATPase domain-containing protein n=1 Tax=Bodo saltans TaxID=75058 RepID=A0A0S4JMV4_BODSA|nr:Hypothetical protein, putative [Bodo saltans]|eukprot:CUG91985.1 Hypothetical protein, putative [Bodo saltans]
MSNRKKKNAQTSAAKNAATALDEADGAADATALDEADGRRLRCRRWVHQLPRRDAKALDEADGAADATALDEADGAAAAATAPGGVSETAASAASRAEEIGGFVKYSGESSNEDLWKWFVGAVQSGNKYYTDVLDEMDRYCLSDVPTNFIGMCSNSEARDTLLAVLHSVEAQFWHLEKQQKRHVEETYFCKLVSKRYEKRLLSNIDSFQQNVAKSLRKWVKSAASSGVDVTSGSKVVALVLAYAKHSSNDCDNDDVAVITALSKVVKSSENVRQEIRASILNRRMDGVSYMVPQIVSKGLLQPLFMCCYQTRQSPPTPIDPFVFHLILVGTRQGETSRDFTWFTKSKALWKEHLAINPEVCDRDDASECEATTLNLLREIGTENAAHILAKPEWWAKHRPNHIDDAPAKIKRELQLVHLAIANPDLLTYREHIHVTGMLADVKVLMLGTNKITQKAARASFEVLRAQHDRDVVQYGVFQAFAALVDPPSGSPFSKWFTDVKKPLFEVNTRLCDFEHKPNPILQGEIAATIERLVKKQKGCARFREIVNHAALGTEKGAAVSFSRALEIAEMHLTTRFENMTIRELNEENETWCVMQDIPRFHAWFKSLEPLKRLLEILESPDGARVKVDHQLIEFLRKAQNITTGSAYKQHDQYCMKFLSRIFPGGLRPEIITTTMEYISREHLEVRSFREKKIDTLHRRIVQAGGHTMHSWSEKDNYKILCAVNTLAMMPRRKQVCVDEYNLGEIIAHVTRIFSQTKTTKDFLSVLDKPALVQLQVLIDSFQCQNVDSMVAKNAATICAHGIFVCQTVEDYDSVGGVVKSYRIKIDSPSSNQCAVEVDYSARHIGEMLSEVRIANKVQGIDAVQKFVAVVPTLVRFVEIGVDCLKRGYWDFVPYCTRRLIEFNKNRSDDEKLKIHSNFIDGRASGFRFEIRIGKIASSEEVHLSEVIRNVALECDRYTAVVREAAARHRVLACFDALELGKILAATQDSRNDVHQLIYRRLGPVEFKKHMLTEFKGQDLSSQIEGVARTLTELCSVNETAVHAPTIWSVVDEYQWPLAVANGFKHASGQNDTNPMIGAFQICLPVGEGPELAASREHFVGRVLSGMTPQNGLNVFCLVVPESKQSADTRNWLAKITKMRYPHPFLVVVHSSVCDLLPAATPAVLSACSNFFDVATYRAFCVIGPSRSGKISVAKHGARELFHVLPTNRIVECDYFLSDTTRPHQLHEMIEAVGSCNAAIVEIGTGSSHHLQALLFSLIIECWTSRDGAAVRREHPVVLKAHSDLRTRLPILELLHLKETSCTRPASSLAHQFVQYAAQRTSIDAEFLHCIGHKLECATRLPLTKVAWKLRSSSSSELRDLQGSIELPDYLLTFDDQEPVIICLDAELTQNVEKAPFTHNNQSVKWLYLKEKRSDDLWKLAFRLLGTPEDKRIIPATVMTPSIFQSLIRLDLSVKCRRQRDVSSEDDGAVTFVGETGCGKTQLVDTYYRYSNLGMMNPRVINVTAGTTQREIIDAVRDFCKEFELSKPQPMIVFFDEFNTSPAQDIIKRIVLDRRLPGRAERLPSSRDGLLFVAACNPYEELPGKGNILKYSVQAHISPSLERTCWRLPQPSQAEEKDIIMSMCTKCKIGEADTNYFVAMIPLVHEFLKTHSNVVPTSLRTVSRLLRLYRYLDRITCLDGIQGKECTHVISNRDAAPPDAENTTPLDTNASSTFAPLAIAVNYFVALPRELRTRLQSKINESEAVTTRNVAPLQSILDNFGERLRALFTDLLDGVDDAVSIKKLRRPQAVNESIAVTYLCVHSQTPLFLIGPPGSSKSLATMLVVWAKLHEKAQPNHLRRLDPLFFQCSKTTSTEAVHDAMRNAKTQHSAQASFVHVFDEIGNADQAYGRPLRALNQYLERSVFRRDGTLDDIGVDSVPDHSAFLGTSNYYLDRSLLGRAVVLQRDNPTYEEMKELFQHNGTLCMSHEVIDKIHDNLQKVTSLQDQENIHQYEKRRTNVLTMRDIFGLVTLAMPDGQTSTTARTQSDYYQLVVKALGRRGHLLMNERSNFKQIQQELLNRRLQQLANELQRKTPRNKTYYQSRQRPLMLETDSLSTVLAAVAPTLSEYVNIIYGRYLVKDDQMATQTMLQLKQAMVAQDQVCLLVDCEPLFDSLLDVFNGFYQKDESYGDGPLLTVRVVVDGRSEIWPITKDFCNRCIFVVIDPTKEPGSFTPAVESRFEKISISAETVTTVNNSVAAAYTDHQRDLGIDTMPSFDPPAASFVVGYHPLMMPFETDQKGIMRQLRHLTNSGVVLHTSTQRDKALEDVIGLCKAQRLSTIMSREQKLYLVMCPIAKKYGDNRTTTSVGELQSINDTNALLRYVEDSHNDVRTLTVGAATPDMLFHVAIKNLLKITTSVAAIGISHSDSNPLTESHLLAICHLIDSIISQERLSNLQVILFAPAVEDLQLTIPRGWEAYFCEMVKPLQRPRTEVSRALSETEFAQRFYLHEAADTSTFIRSLESFTAYVNHSIGDKCLQYLESQQTTKSRTTSQAVEEILMYREFVLAWRLKLCMHFSNDAFFIRHQANVNAAGWTALFNSAAGLIPRGPKGAFLLNPCKDGSLPLTGSVAHNNRDSNRDAPNSIPSLGAANAACRALQSLHPSAGTWLSNRYFVTVARLCGAQAALEIKALVEMHKESKKVEDRTHAVLPLAFSKLGWLRVVISPRQCNHHVRHPEIANVLKLLQASDGKTSDNAFVDVCGEDSEALNRICFNPLSLGSCDDRSTRLTLTSQSESFVRPQEKELFVRWALSFGMNFAKSALALSCRPEDFTESGCNVKQYPSLHMVKEGSETFFSLRRYFMSHIAGGDADGTTFLNVLTALRARFFEEKLADLPYIGHYSYVIRQLHDLLFTPTPPTLRCVVTRAMKETLTIDSIPKELKDYIIQLIGEDVVENDKNIVSILHNLLERLNKLIDANNAFLVECDKIIAQHASERLSPKARRHIHWSYVTVHHQVMSHTLIDEVILTPGPPLARLWHLEEVLIGLPVIDKVDELSGEDVFSKDCYKFVDELTPSDLF